MRAYYLPYRGHIQGMTSAGAQTAFVTTHAERQPTALYRLDTSEEKPRLTLTPLPCGITALASDGSTLWLAGEDGKLYHAPCAQGQVEALAGVDTAPAKVLALACLAERQLAILQEQQLSLVNLSTGQVLQSIAYSESATVMASNPEGNWLAVGNRQGGVAVYQREQGRLILSDARPLHQGEVTALRFTTHDLNFYSAGSDKKLLLTHAQGTLEPLDKGRSHAHEENLYALHLGATRLFTGAHDKSIKAWSYTGGQPLTLKQGLPKVAALTQTLYQDKPCLLAAGRDASFRLIGLNAEERFTEVLASIEDGYALAKQLLQRPDPKERERAIELLAHYDDQRAFQLMSQHSSREPDPAIRSRLVTVAQKSQHPQAIVLLEGFLKDKQAAAVRQQAFAALVQRAAPEDLRPYEQALATGFNDLGAQALEGLARLGQQSSRAERLLVQALDHPQSSLRLLALKLLEQVYAADSAQASLQALGSTQSDVQRAALIRLFQRRLLDDFTVQRALLLAQDHADANLRRSAFLVTISGRPALTHALKALDADLARQLRELENFAWQAAKPDSSPPSDAAALTPTAQQALRAALTPEDKAVLLQSLGSRHADISFQAAFALALLQDPCALGSLLLLSQEQDPAIRIGVCRAFTWLGPTGGSLQALELLLNDSAATVRDAAFSALLHLHAESLRTAQRGFATQHQDIHARSLKTLLDGFDPGAPQALALLKAALDDPFPAIRQETFKACLNRQLGGDALGTLNLLRGSQFENIHQEVLNELMSKSPVAPALDWVEPLLCALFADAFAAVRLAACKFALQEKKRFPGQRVLAAAVRSPFSDVRHSACAHIRAHPDPASQVHLQVLVGDRDPGLRSAALELLIGDPASVTEALHSPYEDVQVQAACALAAWGDPRAIPALETLLARPEPRTSHERAPWVTMVQQALAGLGASGDARAFATLLRFIQHSDATLVERAAAALPWVVEAEHLEALLRLQADERPTVRVQASFALALLGEARALALLADPQLRQQLPAHHRLAARLCLGEVTPVSLQEYLEAEATRHGALWALACHEILLHPEAPYLSTWALSLRQPEVQRFCADLLACYGDASARWDCLVQWLMQAQQGGEHSPWRLEAVTAQPWAAVLVYGSGRSKVHLLGLLARLETPLAQAAWNLHLQAFHTRHAAAIAQAQQRLPAPKPPKPLQALWNQQAFGAYLGLIRQDNEAHTRPQALSLRLQALRGLSRLAERDAALRTRVSHSLVNFLHYPQGEVRQLAFDTLKTLGMDLARLGNTAATSPHSDIARQGLQLLLQHYPLQQSHGLLQTLIREGNDLLSLEAYPLYSADVGLFKAAPLALRARNLALRERCIHECVQQYIAAADTTTPLETALRGPSWWQAQYAAHEATALLLEATRNEHFPVVREAATCLARTQHPAALETLKNLLEQASVVEQQRALVEILALIPKPQIAEILLEYLKHSKLNRQPAAELYARIAAYRHPGIFAALLHQLEAHPTDRSAILAALLAITGADQIIEDYEEARSDTRWQTQQHPRHDALLAQLFDALIRLNHPEEAVRLCPALAWAHDPSADQALLAAIPKLGAPYLAPLITALSFRLRKRGGSPAGLLQLISHKDIDLQFLAAEGLAQSGHPQGFSILLAAIDYHKNAAYRHRAVIALGRSGDLRALDKLLSLAQDAAHALHAAAVEAIGHLSRSEQAEPILKLLKSSLRNASYASALQHAALNGLRWFNTLPAWQHIAAYSVDSHQAPAARSHAVSLLQHWDTEASRNLLLNLLRQDTEHTVVQAAYTAARHLWQASAEAYSAPDAALLQGHYPQLDPQARMRILQDAPSAQRLALLAAQYAQPEQQDAIRQELAQSLIQRGDYAAEALDALLGNAQPEIVGIAAQLHACNPHPAPTSQAHLQTALAAQVLQWRRAQDTASPEALKTLQTTVAHLLWATLRHGYPSATILDLLKPLPKAEQGLQIHILTALLAAGRQGEPTLVAAVTDLLRSPLPAVSTLAAQWLAQQASTTPLAWQHFLAQPRKLLAPAFATSLAAAAAQPADQARVIPTLIAQQDAATLASIAQDTRQLEKIRLGAIEGLAHIPTAAARTALQTLHRQETDPDVAKAAYRALRRQQRCQAAPPSGAPA